MEKIFDTSDVIFRIKSLAGYSNWNIPELYIKIEPDAIFVNEVTCELYNSEYTYSQIAEVLVKLKEIGAVDVNFAEDCVMFLDSKLLLGSKARS